MAESRLDILLNFIKKGKGDKEAVAGLKGLDKAQDKAADSAKNFTNFLGGAGIALAAFAKAVEITVELTKLDTQVQRANVALIAFAGGADEAEAALEGVERAAGGTLDKLSATQNAARLFSMGLASNAEEAEKLTRIAITLGAAMGTGPQQAFEDFTLLLANQSIQRLDTFGISSGKVRERIGELTTGVGALDRETAFMTATLEDAERKLAELDAAGFDASNSLEQLEATLSNLKIEAASRVAPAVLKLADTFQLLLTWNDQVDKALQDTGNTLAMGATDYEDYIRQVVALQVASGQLTEKGGELRVEFLLLNRESKEVAEANNVMTQSMFFAATGADDLAQDMAKAWLETQNLSSGVDDATTSAMNFESELKDLQALIKSDFTKNFNEAAASVADLRAEEEDLLDTISQLEGRPIITREEQTILNETLPRLIEINQKIKEMREEGETEGLKDLQEEAEELRKIMGEIETFSLSDADIEVLDESKDKLEDVQAEIQAVEDAWEKQTAEMVVNMLAQQAAIGGVVTDEELAVIEGVAERWGLVDDTMGVITARVLNVTNSTTLSAQQQIDAINGVIGKYGNLESKIRGIDGLRIATSQVHTITTVGDINAVTGGFAGTTGSGFAFGQEGLNMTVPPGFNNDNFMIGATSGENVTITPPGEVPGGNAGNGSGATNNFGDVILADPVMMGMFFEELGLQ
jgi:hypothetical protein